MTAITTATGNNDDDGDDDNDDNDDDDKNITGRSFTPHPDPQALFAYCKYIRRLFHTHTKNEGKMILSFVYVLQCVF